MREQLETLRQALCDTPMGTTESGSSTLDPAEIPVVLPAGGFGYRMRGATDTGITQKCLYPLPDGETLIGRLLREYAAAGFRRFVALVNHEGRAVEEYLAGGTPWGVVAHCSFDPDGAGSGRSGAIAHAVAQGLLPTSSPVIVHNADCHLLRYQGCFPLDLLASHAAAVGALATLVAVDGSPYPFTGMRIEAGRVREIEMYPFIPVPVHAGMTVLSAEAIASVAGWPTDRKGNFERDFFPVWAQAGRLGAMVIPFDHWVAVDDRKAYQRLCDALCTG